MLHHERNAVNSIGNEQRTSMGENTGSEQKKGTNELIERVNDIRKNSKRKDRGSVESFQMVQLPLWDERVRGLPNALARSALFTSANRKEKRLNHVKHPIAAVGGVEISYTGMELRQDDLDVFLQVVHLARNQPLGEMIQFSGYSLLKALGWSPTKANYERLRQCIDRMSATTIHVSFREGSRVLNYGGSLFRKFTWDADALSGMSQQWKIWLEKEIITLFGDSSYTQIVWSQRLSLPPLAKWLHQFYFTHKVPFGYRVEVIHTLCASRIPVLAQFRAKLRASLEILVRIGFLESYHIDKRTDVVTVRRTEKKELAA